MTRFRLVIKGKSLTVEPPIWQIRTRFVLPDNVAIGVEQGFVFPQSDFEIFEQDELHVPKSVSNLLFLACMIYEYRETLACLQKILRLDQI